MLLHPHVKDVTVCEATQVARRHMRRVCVSKLQSVDLNQYHVGGDRKAGAGLCAEECGSVAATIEHVHDELMRDESQPQSDSRLLLSLIDRRALKRRCHRSVSDSRCRFCQIWGNTRIFSVSEGVAGVLSVSLFLNVELSHPGLQNFRSIGFHAFS